MGPRNPRDGALAEGQNEQGTSGGKVGSLRLGGDRGLALLARPSEVYQWHAHWRVLWDRPYGVQCHRRCKHWGDVLVRREEAEEEVHLGSNGREILFERRKLIAIGRGSSSSRVCDLQ